MAVRQARYSRDEFVQRGQEIYDRDVRPILRPDDKGRFVAIDIESASFEIDADDYTAIERLLKRKPDAQIWLARADEPAAYRIGRRTPSGGAA